MKVLVWPPFSSTRNSIKKLNLNYENRYLKAISEFDYSDSKCTLSMSREINAEKYNCFILALEANTIECKAEATGKRGRSKSVHSCLKCQNQYKYTFILFFLQSHKL